MITVYDYMQWCAASLLRCPLSSVRNRADPLSNDAPKGSRTAWVVIIVVSLGADTLGGRTGVKGHRRRQYRRRRVVQTLFTHVAAAVNYLSAVNWHSRKCVMLRKLFWGSNLKAGLIFKVFLLVSINVYIFTTKDPFSKELPTKMSVQRAGDVIPPTLS